MSAFAVHPSYDPTPRRAAGRSAWVIPWLLSLAVHAGAAGLLAAQIAGGAPGATGTAADRSTPEDAEPPEHRLGIERSRHVTLNWLGFEDPTPHAAPIEAAVEQSQLSRSVGDPFHQTQSAPPAPTDAESDALAEAWADAQATPPPAPLPADSSLLAAPEDDPILPEPSMAPASSLGDRPTPADLLPPLAPEAPVGPVAARPPRIDPSLPTPTPAASPSRTPEATPTPVVAAPPEAVPTPEVAPPAPARGGGAPEAEPGLPSDRSADAVSAERAIETVLGQVAAGEGVRIRTERPQLSTTTWLTARPASPTVVIDFDRRGRVVNARFDVRETRVLSTGNAAVDDALLAAIYNWTAQGDRIDALGEGETLRQTMHISWK